MFAELREDVLRIQDGGVIATQRVIIGLGALLLIAAVRVSFCDVLPPPPQPLTAERKAQLAQAAQEDMRLREQYSKVFLPAHRRIWGEIERLCRNDSIQAHTNSIDMSIVIDSTGLVKDFFVFPNSEHFDCLRRHMLGAQYPKPPTAPFFEHVMARIHRPSP